MRESEERESEQECVVCAVCNLAHHLNVLRGVVLHMLHIHAGRVGGVLNGELLIGGLQRGQEIREAIENCGVAAGVRVSAGGRSGDASARTCWPLCVCSRRS